MARTAQVPNIFDDAIRIPPKTSVLRSILSAKGHRRSPSAGDALLARRMEGNNPFATAHILPVDHPHAGGVQRPLGERTHNRDAASGSHLPQKSSGQDDKMDTQKKTKSSVSLKTLMKDKEKKSSKSNDTRHHESQDKRAKKTKSSTSLSALLKRSQRGPKAQNTNETGEKENRTPTEVSAAPIWGQFVTQPPQDQSSRICIPDSGRTFDEEVSLYTPQRYSPSKQRNFDDYHQPTLARRPDHKPRPKSDYITSGTWKVREILGHVHRIPSGKQRNLDQTPATSSPATSCSRHSQLSETRSDGDSRRDIGPSPSSREMTDHSDSKATGGIEYQKGLDRIRIESEFEKLLDARDIPQNMRDKMRSLDTNIKADFIKKDRAEGSLCSNSSSTTAVGSSRRQRRSKELPATPTETDGKSSQETRSLRSSKNRAFTWSRGDVSPPKKHNKSESGSSHKRPKSVDMTRPGSSKQLTPSSSMTSLSATVRPDTIADPADFIHYLREVQKPEIVEVGKLHKLRLLLRNETVGWVDTFISTGGMDEVVQLLYRIMKVEWREEHEDALLHETLLCLKALCTTSLALKRLTAIEAELFPALLKMLFDEEKKGPSEFTTRSIVISLLFTHLSTAPAGHIPARASAILSYLRDPSPSGENQPLEFIANIYQSRPYRVWCKEVTNVTKEVFWIFLHHLNVVPVAPPNDPTLESEGSPSFLQRHFPSPRPPVPAAPYVGGVEWDATNYLATHLDLLNGLIASLPTSEERNNLRMELRASGFEKVMGSSLRTCKEKFYAAVHDCLKTWVAAAREDGWAYTYVREGPPRGEPGSPSKSPIKALGGSPKKSNIGDPPRLALAVDLGTDKSMRQHDNLSGWI